MIYWEELVYCLKWSNFQIISQRLLFCIGYISSIFLLPLNYVIFYLSSLLQYPFEVLFRSQQFALLDYCCREYIFLSQFFLVTETDVLKLFKNVMSSTIQLVQKEVNPRSSQFIIQRCTFNMQWGIRKKEVNPRSFQFLLQCCTFNMQWGIKKKKKKKVNPRSFQFLLQCCTFNMHWGITKKKKKNWDTSKLSVAARHIDISA